MTSRGAAYGLTAQVANKIASKRDPAEEAEILNWIGAILGEKLPAGKFEDVLRDGVILCKMIEKLVPGAVAKVSTRGGKFEHMENINNFLNVCRRVGVPAVDLFQTVDLYENRNIPAVTQCLMALARKCNLQVQSGASKSTTQATEASGSAKQQQQKVTTSTSEGPGGSTITTITTTTTTKKANPNDGQVQQQQFSSSSSNSCSRTSSSTSGTKQQQQLERQDSKSEAREKSLDMSSQREEMIQRRQREAAESKARTLQMYDNMAKSGNAGEKRAFDISTYTGKSGSPMISGSVLQKTDLVEETIRERVRASEENKKRLLAAFDYAAKTQPAGTVRDVDLAAFQGVDVSSFEQDKTQQGAATFRSSNGVPQVVKVNHSVPSTPVIDIKKAPSFSQEQPHLDAYERALRQRKEQADERKRRTLAAYDAIARSGVCGPKIVVKEELEHMDISDQETETEKSKPKFSCTSSFSGGYARI